MIRATYEFESVEGAEAFAEHCSVGVPWGADHARARLLEAPGDAERVVVEFPAAVWGDDLTLLLSTVVAGEAVESASVSRCRLVDLELPAGLFPGPAFAAPDQTLIGAQLQPAMGVTATELGSVAADLARGGVDVVLDPVPLADPPWCPLEDRVAEVTNRIPGDVTYFANVTGNTGTLMHRATTAVDMGAGGLVIHAGTQGLDAVRLLRDADLGVPIFAHRVGFGSWLRSERFGVAPAVLARLTRLAGGDCVMCGAAGGQRFDDEADVEAQVAACQQPLVDADADAGDDGVVPAAVAVLDGGLDPSSAAANVKRFGISGLMVLLDRVAYRFPGGVEAAVRETVEAIDGLTP